VQHEAAAGFDRAAAADADMLALALGVDVELLQEVREGEGANEAIEHSPIAPSPVWRRYRSPTG